MKFKLILFKIYLGTFLNALSVVLFIEVVSIGTEIQIQ